MQPVTTCSPFSFLRKHVFSFNYGSYTLGNYIITINATDNTAHNYYIINGALHATNGQ